MSKIGKWIFLKKTNGPAWFGNNYHKWCSDEPQTRLFTFYYFLQRKIVYVFLHSTQPNIKYLLPKLTIWERWHIFFKTTTNIVCVVACVDPRTIRLNEKDYMPRFNETEHLLLSFSLTCLSLVDSNFQHPCFLNNLSHSPLFSAWVAPP